MKWLSDIFESGTSGVFDGIGKILSVFKLSPGDQKKLDLELQKLLMENNAQLQKSIQSELQAKERIIVAELSQGDEYTKRARPTILYTGLVFILINYIIVPIIQLASGLTIDPFPLPTEFWIAWGGIASIYSIGRSAEKYGMRNKLTEKITGNTRSRSLLD